MGSGGAMAETQARTSMAEEVRQGLLEVPRRLPSKYFYDDAGSALFDAITELPEYYPTRTERALLERLADDIVDAVRPAEIAEIGCGTGSKTRLLLDAARDASVLRRIRLLDVNGSVLASSRRQLGRDYPGVDVTTVTGDFAHDLALLGRASPRLLLFLGSTIGNLEPAEAHAFLQRVAEVLGPADAFLVGFDLVKDVAVLEAAYNDAAGVTARFNQNILRALNKGLGGNFDPEGFDHVAFFDRRRSWIEMRLRARRSCRVRLPGAGLDLLIHAGEEIRTEISCKYTRASVEALLDGTGLRLARWDTDPAQLFALGLLRPLTS
jgi:L-histidine N-alpha-methyltransferase